MPLACSSPALSTARRQFDGRKTAEEEEEGSVLYAIRARRAREDANRCVKTSRFSVSRRRLPLRGREGSPLLLAWLDHGSQLRAIQTTRVPEHEFTTSKHLKVQNVFWPTPIHKDKVNFVVMCSPFSKRGCRTLLASSLLGRGRRQRLSPTAERQRGGQQASVASSSNEGVARLRAMVASPIRGDPMPTWPLRPEAERCRQLEG